MPATPITTRARRVERIGRAGAMSALVALAALLTVELLRAFPALVATRVDVAGRLPFAVQVVVLVTPFLVAATSVAVVGRRGRDARHVLLAAGAALAAGRMVAQLVHGDVGAVVAGVGLAGGLVVLLLLAQIGLPLFGGGVVAGVGLAAALRIALGSRDLIWIDHAGAVAVVAAAVAWFALLLRARARRPVELLGRSRRAAVPLLAVGPVLLLEAFVLTNLGWVAPALDRGWLGASFTIGGSAAAGLAAAAWTAAAPGGSSRLLGPVGAVAVVALSVAHAAPSPWWAAGVVAAQAGVGSVLTAASSRGVRTGGAVAPARALAWAPLLLLAAVVALDGRGLLGLTVRPSAVVAGCGVLLLVAAAGLAALPAPAPHHPGWRHLPSLAAVFVLPAALLLAGLPILARTGGGAHVGDSRELRVVSYNVQLGFTGGGALNLEEVAAVLAAERPDVVALQEVPRGFLPAAGIDMIGWLQHTLGMPYVAFQSSSPGALHGNAVLSRYPIRSVASRWFPRSGTALPRGAVSARIDVPDGADVHVISAHFPPGGTRADREARVRTLLALWGDRPRTIVGLDANSRPTSIVLGQLADAGLVVPDSDVPTFPSQGPLSRIDYVLHSDDLVAVEVGVRPSRASDHLPVVTVLRPSDLV